MIARSLRGVVAATLALTLTTCAAGGAPDRTPATSVVRSTATGYSEAAAHSTPASTTAAAPPTTVAGDLALTGLQAQEVATFIAFIRAYNAGRLDEALAFFSDDPLAQFSDCDYRENRQIGGHGREAIAQWLAQRMADHDRLIVGRVELSSRSPIAIGVVYERRTSDTLRTLGQPDGFTPRLGTKVIFADDGTAITSFAHGCG